jgi:type I restriction enzyme M protein
MPANLFFGTSIPTTVIILKKNRTSRDVLFIDASKDFIKGKNQNKLSQENIDRIVETYKKREDVEKFAHVASFEEIRENDFNLNIPRYVDTFEEQEEVDIVELGKELVALNQQIKAAENDFLAMLDELAITDETREIIEATKAVFR